MRGSATKTWRQVQEPIAVIRQRNIPLEKAFQFKQQAVGRILKKAKLAGSWLTEDDFYPVGKGPQLKLKEGYRAVNLRIDDPAISSNVIQAGCLVDVIFTTDNPDDYSKLTRRLASGLEVLSPPVSEGSVPNSVDHGPGDRGLHSKKSYIVAGGDARSGEPTGPGPADGRHDQHNALRRAEARRRGRPRIRSR